MTKRQTTKTKYQPEKQWLQLLTIFVLVVALAVGGIGLWKVNEGERKAEDARIVHLQDQRKQRIEAIFDSFNIDESYKVTTVNIFGDKRTYAWDSGRTYASSIEYMRFEPVDDTAVHARQAIEQAGFEVVDEPYPDSVTDEYHFVNDQGEHVSLTVTSRDINDAIMTGEAPKDADKNAAPSIVLIEVNLDDNNE